MHIELIDGRYVATCSMSDRDALREAGFIFDRLALRKWYTTDWRKVAVFVDQCIGSAYDKVRALLDEHEEALEASYAMFADADIARPHITNHKGEVLDYLPYQKAGILYAAERDDTLIGDSPGLGKTIQAIGLINHLGLQCGLIVCPATLKLNWLKEMLKWLVDKNLTVGVAYGVHDPRHRLRHHQLRHPRNGTVMPVGRAVGHPRIATRHSTSRTVTRERTESVFGDILRWTGTTKKVPPQARAHEAAPRRRRKVTSCKANYRVMLPARR
jgi:hypothetical protein